MANRFKQALGLNLGDELVWYVKYHGRHAKCLWRNSSSLSEHLSLTFVATYQDDETVITVFTLQL